jgi:hypothetical protein
VVHVLIGSPIGLLGAGSLLFSQNTPGIAGGAKRSDHFGFALAAGDFDGDGYADLAIGVPQDDLSGVANAGAVNVLYGSSIGLDVPRNQIWHQNSGSIGDTCEASDTFGWSLTSGDFNGDGRDDLAIGVSHEKFGAIASAGAVNVIFGSTTGLTDAGNLFITQDALGGGQTPSPQDVMGWSIVAGDFNDDGHADLAIGSPLENVDGAARAGIVQVVYGDAGGLDLAGAEVWSQNVGNVPDVAESDDWFGAALARGDFDGDGVEDLAIGSPFEDDVAAADAGALFILLGSNGGLTDSGSVMFTQSDLGEGAEPNDGMCWSLLR